VDVRIGIINAPREVAFESSESAAQVEQLVTGAFAQGAPHVIFTDEKGKRYLVPTASIAYVEIGSDKSRQVGFVA
jgi:thioredoxin-related protein